MYASSPGGVDGVVGPGRAINEAWLVTRSSAALGQESSFLPAGAPAANPTPSCPELEEIESIGELDLAGRDDFGDFGC